MPQKSTYYGPFPAVFLPQFNISAYSARMNSFVVLRNLVVGTVALAAAFSASPLQASSSEQEFPTETAALIAATSAFFDAAERAAQKRDTPSQPVIGLPQIVSPASLQASDAAFEPLTNHGAVQHLTGYRINWYPVSRLLGTVDFMGTWDGNRNLVCGYISWDVTTPDAPVLESVTANYVDMDELASLSPSKAHEALLEANCAFGAIDVNFAFFDPIN